MLRSLERTAQCLPHCAGSLPLHRTARRYGPIQIALRARSLARVFSGLLLCLCLLAASPLQAGERILDYDIAVDIQPSGELAITERIKVRAEGQSIRRGIFRDFPTRYTDRWGNNVVVGFEVIEVLRDGMPEPWFTERMSNGVRVNTGGDELLPALPAEYSYTLRYQTDSQLGFFQEHDELYWNAIGTGWAFSIERASVEVRLPSPIPVAELSVEGYTGVQGAREQHYQVNFPGPGSARWELTAPLAPREGMTIVLGFPKGLITPPSELSIFWKWLQANALLLVLLVLFVPWVFYLVWSWWLVGRDPGLGVIYPRYEVPRNFEPGVLRLMRRSLRFDAQCLTADLLQLAVAGFIRIDVEQRSWRKDKWTLVRSAEHPVPSADTLTARLLARLFPSGHGALTLDDSSDLKKRLRSVRNIAETHHQKCLKGEFYAANDDQLLKAVVPYLAMWGLAFLMGVTGVGHPPILIACLALGFLMIVIYGFLIGAPTEAGRVLLAEIEGFKHYLSIAEVDDIERLAGPNGPPMLDAGRFEQLLPYAVALEVTDAWTEKFAAAVGQQEAERYLNNRVWCRGFQGRSLASLTDAISTEFAGTIASSSAPPGSSSGSGGGGFSGGGGGGGGGGGR